MGIKITKRCSILNLVGIISKDEANGLRDNIKELRRRLRKKWMKQY